MTGSCPVSAHVCRETARERDELRAEVERLRAAANSLLEKALERGADGQVPAVSVVEIREAFNPTEGDRDE